MNFAVAANYMEYNTGMHWTTCTVDVSSELGLLEPVLSTPAPHMINVQWSLDKVCSSLLEGFNLTYCRMDPSLASASTPNNLSISNEVGAANACLERTATTITIPSLVKKYDITNLQPYSVYKIEMYMFSKLKKGKISHQFITTKEGGKYLFNHIPLSYPTFNDIIINIMKMFWT